MKKIFTIFLLLIITVQTFPITQLSKCFSDKEYVQDDLCEDGEVEKKFEADSIVFTHDFLSTKTKKLAQNHFPIYSSGLQPHPIVDITTPPPNA
jgi:hypothetical protein